MNTLSEASQTRHEFSVEFITDPKVNARRMERMRQFNRNINWAASRWEDIVERAAGSYIAVVDEDLFVADSACEAERLAKESHPDSEGIFVRFVSPVVGPRVYGNRWNAGSMS